MIIIQADEGPFPAALPGRRAGASVARRDRRASSRRSSASSSRCASPVRDVEADGFTTTITPVNTFRVIFNARFGTDLPLLPDRDAGPTTDLDHFYDFFEITDRLRR